MKVILDEGVPKQVARHLRGHEVTTVPDAGWGVCEERLLLSLIQDSGFRVFVTCDKNIPYQQSRLALKPFGILILSTNHWPTMEPQIARVADAVDACASGTITHHQGRMRHLHPCKVPQSAP